MAVFCYPLFIAPPVLVQSDLDAESDMDPAAVQVGTPGTPGTGARSADRPCCSTRHCSAKTCGRCSAVITSRWPWPALVTFSLGGRACVVDWDDGHSRILTNRALSRFRHPQRTLGQALPRHRRSLFRSDPGVRGLIVALS